MAVPSRLHIPWRDINSSLPSAVPTLPLYLDLTVNTVPCAIATILVLVVIISVYAQSSYNNGRKVPTINPKQRFELTNTRTRHEFDNHSWDMMHQAIRKFPDQPFNVLSGDLLDALVLPPRYANEIKNDERFSFVGFIAKSFHGNLPGFASMGVFNQPNRIIQLIAQQDLTRSIPRMIGVMSKELDKFLLESLSDSTTWHDVVAKETLLPLVARISTLAFLGKDMCNNKDWIDISVNFTVEIVLAAEALANWPMWLRPFANLYLVPQCRDLRTIEAKAQVIIGSQLEKRRKLKAEAKEKHIELEFNDALEWYQKQYANLGGTFDPTATQLTLSLTAIQTTTDLLTQVILDLAEHQDMIQPLRKEVIDCLQRGKGINKTSLYNMKLLDSTIKESQRLKPGQLAHMTRDTLADVTLSDGVQIKRGSTIMVVSRMRDPSLYEDPDKYDAYRFYRLRQQPGKEKTAQLVTTSIDHLAFGHGQHACPGRFFAAHEIKIVLCHLLLKYEWKLAEGIEKPQWKVFGNNIDCDRKAKITIRRRDAGEVEGLLVL